MRRNQRRNKKPKSQKADGRTRSCSYCDSPSVGTARVEIPTRKAIQLRYCGDHEAVAQAEAQEYRVIAYVFGLIPEYGTQDSDEADSSSSSSGDVGGSSALRVLKRLTEPFHDWFWLEGSKQTLPPSMTARLSMYWNRVVTGSPVDELLIVPGEDRSEEFSLAFLAHAIVHPREDSHLVGYELRIVKELRRQHSEEGWARLQAVLARDLTSVPDELTARADRDKVGQERRSREAERERQRNDREQQGC